MIELIMQWIIGLGNLTAVTMLAWLLLQSPPPPNYQEPSKWRKYNDGFDY